MDNKRHKILHLRGTKNLTIEHANELNFENGEIAIKHGNNGDSELYVLTQDGNNIDSFVTKTYIDNVTNNITNDIIENEEVIATALTNLDNRLLDVESGTSVVFNEYVKKNEITKIATTGSYNDLTDKPTMPTVDTLMSDTSTNAVQNKIIKSYIDNNCNIPLETTTVSSKTLSPNKYYKWTNSLSSITITLETPSNSNILNNYMFEFTVSETGCTLIVPDTIKWLNGVAPVLEATKTYQISIINNLATVAKFG